MIIILTFSHIYEDIQTRLNLNPSGFSLHNGTLEVKNFEELIESSLSKDIWFLLEAVQNGSEESVLVGDELLFDGLEE